MRVYSYERPDSPFVWLKWQSPINGKSRAKSSRVRKTDPERERKIAKQINALEGELLAVAPEHEKEAFEHWVVPYLRQQHSDNEGTLDKNLNSWNWLSGFLRERKVTIPRELTRAQVFDYIPWRCGRKKQKSGKTPLKNTAIYDLRVLGKIMQEALERHFIAHNPCHRLKIKKEAVKVKPELLDGDIQKLRTALVGRPEWMRVAFEVALHTGLRFHETRFNLLTCVDWSGESIFIEKPKGGHGKAFSIDLPPALAPLLRTLREKGQQWTWTHERQKNELPRSLQWRQVFDAAGLRAPFSFHCTRVTFITRNCRAGVPETVTMKMVNHASREISRIYQRLTLADVRQYRGRVQIPPEASPTADSAGA